MLTFPFFFDPWIRNRFLVAISGAYAPVPLISDRLAALFPNACSAGSLAPLSSSLTAPLFALPAFG